MGGVAGSAEHIEVAVARALWDAGDPIVDVRLPEEYVLGHLPGAINIPIDELPFRTGELGDGQVITVCSMGNRSWRAAEALARAGRTALSLSGGTKAWAAAGLPIATGPEPGVRRAGRRWLPGRRRSAQ